MPLNPAHHHLGVAIVLAFLITVVGTLALYLLWLQQAPQEANGSPTREYGRASKNLEANLSLPLILRAGEQEIAVKPELARSWVEAYHRGYTGQTELRFRNERALTYLLQIEKTFAREPANARLEMVDGVLVERVPSRVGTKLDIESSLVNLYETLTAEAYADRAVVPLALTRIEPALTLDKAKESGISTLLARGTSDFTGSSASRVHNIKISSNLFNGAIIQPGEEFSFNTILGEVEASTGYKPELVIKGNRLVYEYGGGICQVSTTLFRAATQAGLPIVERAPHAFPVRYYNPQGFDATIYPGVRDFRFRNDTPGPILIQVVIEGTKISFDFYGTDDGRKVAVDGPYQYDISSTGAMKAVFHRTVTTTAGEEKKESFFSNYRPPISYQSNPLE